MRGCIISLLQSEAKRKPEIAALIENLDNMSAEDIDNAKVPLPWFRKALHQLKKSQLYAATVARVSQNIVHGETEDIEGVVVRYNGAPAYFFTDRGGSIEVQTGDLLFRVEGGIWYDTLYSTNVDPRLEVELVGNFYRQQYREMVWEERQKRLSHIGVPVLFR